MVKVHIFGAATGSDSFYGEGATLKAALAKAGRAFDELDPFGQAEEFKQDFADLRCVAFKDRVPCSTFPCLLEDCGGRGEDMVVGVVWEE